MPLNKEAKPNQEEANSVLSLSLCVCVCIYIYIYIYIYIWPMLSYLYLYSRLSGIAKEKVSYIMITLSEFMLDTLVRLVFSTIEKMVLCELWVLGILRKKFMCYIYPHACWSKTFLCLKKLVTYYHPSDIV